VKKLSEGRQRLRQEAGLDDFELPGIPDHQAPARALAIICSESTVLSVFVALLDPLCILQNLGGTLPTTQSPDDANYSDGDVGWGSVAYALGEMGLRQVVLCGHFGCCVAAGGSAADGTLPVREFGGRNDTRLAEQLVVASELPAPKRASQLRLVEQLLRMDAYLARSCYREADVSMHALWFDEDQHQVYAYSRDQRQFVLMDQRDFERLFEVLRVDREKV